MFCEDLLGGEVGGGCGIEVGFVWWRIGVFT